MNTGILTHPHTGNRWDNDFIVNNKRTYVRVEMKTFKFSTLVLAVLMCMTGFTLVSCGGGDGDDDSGGSSILPGGSDSDNEGSVSGSLVGTWRCDNGVSSYDFTAYSFFEDGTGLYFGDKTVGPVSFSYTFDRSEKKINISLLTYEETKTLSISKLTSDVAVIDGSQYRKCALTNDMLILGCWLLHVDALNSKVEKVTEVIFKSDGTYQASDTVDDTFWGTFYGTYTITDKYITILSDSRTRENGGCSQIVGKYIIDGLVVNGCRLIRAEYPDEYPYLIGGWYNR